MQIAKNKQWVFSIIIPAYNRAHCIAQAIKTAQNQKWNAGKIKFPIAYEIIVVDDGSSDNTAAIVEGLQIDDPCIRLIKNETNKGVSAARNAGIEAACGDFIAFLDSDDVWADHKLLWQFIYLIRLESEELIKNTFCLSYYVNRNDKEELSCQSIFASPRGDDSALDFKRYSNEQLKRGILTRHLWFGIGSTLFAHRSAIKKNGGFNEDLGCGEDTEYVTRHILRGGEITVVPRLLMAYQLPPDGKKYAGQELYHKFMMENYRCEIVRNWGPNLARKFVRSLQEDARNRLKKNWQKTAGKLVIPPDAPCLKHGVTCDLRGNICRRHPEPRPRPGH